MHFYDEWAQRILSGQLTDHLAFYGLPGYPYLLAALYKIAGYGPFVPALLQALLEAGTATLIYKVSVGTFSGTGLRRAQITGVLAALGWAFFVPAQTYAVVLMPTAWFIFIFWVILWRIVSWKNAPTKREALIHGLLVGLAATAIATILFLLPLLVSAILIKPAISTRSQFRARMSALVLLFLGAAAGTSPCWVHNCLIARDPVFLSAHSGINFWIGNNPSANGYPRFPPGLRAGQAAMLQDSIDAAESAAGHPLKRGEVSRFWSAKARHYIERDPAAWLRLLALKLRTFWSAFQYTISASYHPAGAKSNAPWDLFWLGRCLRVTSDGSWMENRTGRALGHICDRSADGGVAAGFHHGALSTACCSRPSCLRSIRVGHVFP
jgi:hypothetical protein